MDRHLIEGLNRRPASVACQVLGGSIESVPWIQSWSSSKVSLWRSRKVKDVYRRKGNDGIVVPVLQWCIWQCHEYNILQYGDLAPLTRRFINSFAARYTDIKPNLQPFWEIDEALAGWTLRKRGMMIVLSRYLRIIVKIDGNTPPPPPLYPRAWSFQQQQKPFCNQNCMDF